MRNLARYPVTVDEIVARLEELATERADDPEPRIGGMDALLLREAARIVKRNGTDRELRNLTRTGQE